MPDAPYLSQLTDIEALLSQGQLPLALSQLKQLCKTYPRAPEPRYRLAILYQDIGQDREAMQSYQILLTLKSGFYPAYLGLGLIAQRQGYGAKAEGYFKQVLSQAPHQPQALAALAQLRFHRAPQEALALWEQSLSIAPNPALRRQLIGHYLDRGALEQALLHLKRWQTEEPENPLPWAEAGLVYKQLKDYKQALSAFRAASARAPQQADIQLELGNLYRFYGQPRLAQDAYQQALGLNPQWLDAHFNLGLLAYEQGNQALALSAFEKAHQLSQWQQSDQAVFASLKDPRLFKLVQAWRLPRIYPSITALKSARSQLKDTMQALLDKPLVIPDPLASLTGTTPFQLAYQGYNDREYNQMLSQIVRPHLPQTLPLKPSQGHFRIGVISAWLYTHAVLQCFGQLIRQLAQHPDIEVWVFLPPHAPQDHRTHSLAESVTQLQYLPEDLASARQTIATAGLNLVLYPEIGMDSYTYLLAHTRLAPHQAVLSGHPVTSGIDTLDIFFSSDQLEIPEAQAHYSEKLVCFPAIAASVSWPEMPARPVSRSELGLSERAHLYICPMTLFKIHPEFDGMLHRILEEDPQAELVFFRYQQTLLHEVLSQRFEGSLSPHSHRVHFIPWQDFPGFLGVLDLADLILDTPHFVGGHTLYFAFARGCPVISWPSPYLRGRSGWGLYRQMGIEAGLVMDLEAYAQQAVELVVNRDKNQALRQAICEQRDLIFNQTDYAQYLIDYCLNILR